MRALLGTLRPWFDPSTRRPLLAMAILPLAVLLVPLAIDVFWALFYRIPPWVRASIGQGSMVTAIALGVWRLCRVRPTDIWPSGSPDNDATRCPAARWIPWALR